MTPSGPYPYPDFPAGGKHTPSAEDEGPRTADPVQDVRAGALAMVLVAVGGLLLGVLWVWLAPRVELISDGRAIYLKDSESEAPIAADGWFTLLGGGLGAVSGALVFWRFRKGGIGIVIGLAVGGLLAALIGMWLGMALGPSDDVVARAKEIGAGKVFDAPLELQAKAALLAWPAGALIAHLLLTGAFGPRDPEPGRWGGAWGPPAGPPAYPGSAAPQDRYGVPYGHGAPGGNGAPDGRRGSHDASRPAPGNDDPWAPPPRR